MSKINDTTSYPTVTPTESDMLVGTDVSDTATDPNGATKNFLISALTTLFGSALAPTYVRSVLTANRTYYVDGTSGSDSNDGLSSGAGAFATIGKAMDIIATLDQREFDVTVSVAADTYAEVVVLPPLIGSGTNYLTGDVATPTNVVIQPGGGSACVDANLVTSPSKWTVNGFDCNTTGRSIDCSTGGNVTIDDLVFSGTATSPHVFVGNGGTVDGRYGAFTVSGDAQYLFFASGNATMLANNASITMSGTPAFSKGTVGATRSGFVNLSNATFTSTATGPRFQCDTVGVVEVKSTSSTYIPGDADGVETNGGRYVVTASGADWGSALSGNYTYGGMCEGLSLEEELTGLSGATATTTIAFPANSIMLSASVRVTTAVTGATSFDVGDGTTAGKFGSTIGVSLGTTDAGLITPELTTSSLTVTLTANGSNFTAGAVRIVIHYLQVTAPTS